MSTVTTDIQQVFLHQIITDPHDDAPRLIYADWLEENGDPERAEFIRVQMELARFPRNYKPPETLRAAGIRPYPPGSKLTPKERERLAKALEKADAYKRLRRRERQLLTKYDYLTRWGDSPIGGLRDPFSAGRGARCLNLLPGKTTAGISIKFHRGFVDYVSMPISTWLAKGKEIVQRWPLTCDSAHDRRPSRRIVCSFSGVFSEWYCWWTNAVNPMDTQPYIIPHEIFEYITGGDTAGDWYTMFDSGKEARTALNKAILNWARDKAGLPLLS